MSKYKFGENGDKNKSDWVRVQFVNLTEEQTKHLHKAETELREAGVLFDTGYNFATKTRDWEFDGSLKGARVNVKKEPIVDELAIHKGCKVCRPKAGGTIPVDDVRKPICSNCGKELLEDCRIKKNMNKLDKAQEKRFDEKIENWHTKEWPRDLYTELKQHLADELVGVKNTLEEKYKRDGVCFCHCSYCKSCVEKDWNKPKKP